ncbi:flagellar motor protein MotS [Virgibacillus natechei]|uniref:flagellar motor protein MotS n=1 Tax=Virgibacillus sp. CBA3643 TaxID=2942278 RepID=UPI0035A290A1
MKRREIKRVKKSGTAKWMTTYSDMVTLILVFFILLFSMSQIDMAKFDAISDSFQNRMIFDFYPSPVPMENPTQSSSHMEKGETSNEFEAPTDLPDRYETDNMQHQEDTLQTLMDDIEKYLDDHDLNNVISADRTERGVVLILQELILFDPGQAELLPSGMPFLGEIGSLLTELPHEVKVEGHTDDRPISSYRYPSNWELSGARASSVVRYLVDENDLDQSRFSIAGYSDIDPLVPNTNPENMSQNRRVEIVILDHDSDTDTEEGGDVQ